MATRVDALRSTLDQLALDPRAQEDRPYLITMLRRLGYSDVEIQAALGPIEEPEPEPVARPPRPEPAPPRPKTVERTPRVIEVEYSGPELSEEFQRIGPDGQPVEGGRTQFQVGGGEGEADEEGIFNEDGEPITYEGEGEDFGDFDMGAVDAVEDSSWDDDWGEGGEYGSALEKREADDGEDLSEAERRKLLEELGLDPDDDSIADFGTREKTTTPKYNTPKAGSTRLLRFEEFTPHEATTSLAGETEDDLPWVEAESYDTPEDLPEFSGTDTEGWQPEEPPAWETGALEAGSWETETWEESGQEAWPESDEEGAWEPAPTDETVAAVPMEEALPSDGPSFTYKDYTLYTREVELSTGRSQRIYFFAKSPPKNGEPCPLPEGYEVKENEQTGLPFLRRTPQPAGGTWGTPEPAHSEGAPEEEGGAAPRRVRAVRVRANSREEAERLLREQGKTVRGAVPIEYDETDEA